MRVSEFFGRGKPVFSFEFFLPKTAEDLEVFKATVRDLKRLAPDFVTMTYGAGGSARERTIEAAGMLKNEIGIETAAHLTCIGHTRAELREILRRILGHGIENIVALRGDQPKEAPPIPVERREVPFARDLVELIRAEAPCALAVAGYPETHPEAASPEADLRNLKAKVDAGADWIITQLFFDNSAYFDFVARARASGIRIPIVPGIMPVTSFAQTRRFTSMCGARMPAALSSELEKIAEDKEAVVRFGIEYAARQCRELLARGAPGIHFYTLNRSRSTATILSELRSG